MGFTTEPVKTVAPDKRPPPLANDSHRAAFPAWQAMALLAALTLFAYSSVIGRTFIWDDDHYVAGNSALRSLDGLRQIWFEVGATPQYYPLTFTTFWIEYHLWGVDPLGYHLVNVLLH